MHTYTIDSRDSERKDNGTRLIVNALVGSRAHGLADEDSDWDYRGVYIVNTVDLLSLGSNPKNVKWVEGKGVDDTSHELGHFLHLATKSNPSVLEIFVAPHYKTLAVDDSDLAGKKLLELFPHVWSSTGVYNAFKGYSYNQHKKFFDDSKEHKDRRWKYAVAYLRVLQLGIDLLSTGTMQTEIEDDDFKFVLRETKKGNYKVGEIVDYYETLKGLLTRSYTDNPDKQTNMEPINEYLLEMRRLNW